MATGKTYKDQLIHMHEDGDGWLIHAHEMGNPGYKDVFDEETHTHLVVLSERNYVHSVTGPAMWRDYEKD